MSVQTGISQPDAIALYRKFGYVERGPFGAYQPDPLSLFMEKRLA
jgi:putative acetyltransferase